jgi:hypothetical protein
MHMLCLAASSLLRWLHAAVADALLLFPGCVLFP